jgi:dihydropteroate synthase
MIRVLNLPDPKSLRQIMQDMRVDDYGIGIMLPKAINRLIRINSISNITANILKQEMLSLGGDVAVSRDSLTGKAKKTDCLLIANLSQLQRLNLKLNKQPFGLNKLAKDIAGVLENYNRDKFTLKLGRYNLNLGKRCHIMAVVNLTPDSFSGDGLYALSVERIVDFVENMIKDGADIIDIGAESSRPGARPVSLKEESSRTIPVVKRLAKRLRVPISIDTSKPQVAKQALDNGASLVNDITGLRNPAMSKVVSHYRAGVVIMHMKGTPRSMQKNIRYSSLMDEVLGYLDESIKQAELSGIDKERIIIDPGIGFAKTAEHNLEILSRLGEFKVLGRPILVGPSRKSFIGKILNEPPKERIFGTVSACVLAVKNGAKIVRVHDVKQVKQALQVSERIEN